MHIVLQLRPSAAAHRAVISAESQPEVTAGMEHKAPGLVIDSSYAPVPLPASRSTIGNRSAFTLTQPNTYFLDPEHVTYLVRGTIPDGEGQSGTFAQITAHPDVLGVFADPLIESEVVCGGDPAVGSTTDVARLLNIAALHAAGMDGSDVPLAIVDTGINVAYLQAKGQRSQMAANGSWQPNWIGTQAGAHPVGHGTMCAFAAGLIAPQAQLLDHAVLLSPTPGTPAMVGLLSDAVRSYSQLLNFISAMPDETRTLVVSNSWGLFSPSWDFPPGHPGNYSDNPRHPFNIIVGSLETAGADIVFAAGNCGRDCPYSKCGFGGSYPLCGANSHPSVTSVAGVDITQTRVGYSSQGPGRLHAQKPDIAAYTHFDGSGVYPVDEGTSVACPLVAGVLAAVRTTYRASRLTPLQLRALLTRTATNVGAAGFNDDYGWGIVDTTALLAALP